MLTLKDKVRGCFLGVAIGDALGKPVECWSQNQIAEKFDRITDYFVNTEHKYYDGMPAGSWTDDTQLTLAVARALIYSGSIDMDTIAEEHATEFVKNISGWGRTTIEAVSKIVDGVHWSQAGFDLKKPGVGNGICMKIAPVGLYMALTNPNCDNPQWNEDNKKIVKFSAMTHFTSMAISSGYAHAWAIIKCFKSDPAAFDVDSFIRVVVSGGKKGEQYCFNVSEEDNIRKRFEELSNHKEYNTERIIKDFGGGSPYVYNSQPFSYMFFVKNPLSLDCMFDCISAGGDADTTGSLVGSLLGALHGTKIFPRELIENLQECDLIIKTADKFYEKFKQNS